MDEMREDHGTKVEVVERLVVRKWVVAEKSSEQVGEQQVGMLLSFAERRYINYCDSVTNGNGNESNWYSQSH